MSGVIDPVAAARGLLPELAARAGDMDEARRLPADLARTMAEAGVFRLVTPRRFGGLEATPRTFVETVETLSTANASAGWCCMIANTSALNAAYMAPEEAEAIFDDPHVITGGVFAPMGRAIAEEGGYRVTGRWQWGSGSANSAWLGGGCTVWENGEMRRLPSGAPETLMAVFPASVATLHDTWHVMGLKGTGSGDIEVKDVFVPEGPLRPPRRRQSARDRPALQIPAIRLPLARRLRGSAWKCAGQPRHVPCAGLRQEEPGLCENAGRAPDRAGRFCTGRGQLAGGPGAALHRDRPGLGNCADL